MARRFRNVDLPGGNVLRVAGPTGTPITADVQVEETHVQTFRVSAADATDISATAMRELGSVYSQALAQIGRPRDPELIARVKSLVHVDRRTPFRGIEVVEKWVNSMRFKYARQAAHREYPERVDITQNNLRLQNGVRTAQNISATVSADAALPEIVAPFLIRQEPDIPEHVQDQWIRRSVKLVKEVIREPGIGIVSIPASHYDRIEEIVTAGIRRGTRPETTLKQLAQLDGITKRRAEVIARDQIVTHNGRMTQIRHEKLGITHYFWKTVGDQRVRKLHRLREGKKFAYDSPPNAVKIDGHPGIGGIQCRCWPSPDLRGAMRQLSEAA